MFKNLSINKQIVFTNNTKIKTLTVINSINSFINRIIKRKKSIAITKKQNINKKTALTTTFKRKKDI